MFESNESEEEYHDTFFDTQRTHTLLSLERDSLPKIQSSTLQPRIATSPFYYPARTLQQQQKHELWK